MAGDETVLKLLVVTVTQPWEYTENTLETTGLCILQGRVRGHVNYISIKLLEKKRSHMPGTEVFSSIQLPGGGKALMEGGGRAGG